MLDYQSQMYDDEIEILTVELIDGVAIDQSNAVEVLTDTDDTFIELNIASNDEPSLIELEDDSENFFEVDSIENSMQEDVDMTSEIIYRKGYSPYINENDGFWWVWDEEEQIYVNSGVPATSTTGSIPIIPIKDIDKYWFTKEVID